MRSLIDYITESTSKYAKYAKYGLEKDDLRTGDVAVCGAYTILYMEKKDVNDLKAYREWIDPSYDPRYDYDSRPGPCRWTTDGNFVLHDGDFSCDCPKMRNYNDRLKCVDICGAGGSLERYDILCVLRGAIDPIDLFKKHPRSAKSKAHKQLKEIYKDLVKSGFLIPDHHERGEDGKLHYVDARLG